MKFSWESIQMLASSSSQQATTNDEACFFLLQHKSDISIQWKSVIVWFVLLHSLWEPSMDFVLLLLLLRFYFVKLLSKSCITHRHEEGTKHVHQTRIIYWNKVLLNNKSKILGTWLRHLLNWMMHHQFLIQHVLCCLPTPDREKKNKFLYKITC